MSLEKIKIKIVQLLKKREKTLIPEKRVFSPEYVVIRNLIKEIQPKNIFEIGTFQGKMSLVMASETLDDSKIFTLNIPKEVKPRLSLDPKDRDLIDESDNSLFYKNRPVAGKITQLYGDSATYNFSPYYNKMDLVFVDGSHSYDYVVSDSLRALDMLRPGGVIIWDDYGRWNGVTKALNDLYINNPKFSKLGKVKGVDVVVLRT
jgi:predicted O-methyltransferase YrrM